MGHKSGDQWYGKQVAPLELMRFIIKLLFDNTPDCSFAGDNFISDFSQSFARVLHANTVNVDDKLAGPRGVKALLMTLAFWSEIVLLD